MGYFLVFVAAVGAFLYVRFAATTVGAPGAPGAVSPSKQLEVAEIDQTFEKRLDAALADGAILAFYKKVSGAEMPPSAVASMRAEAVSRWYAADAHDVAEMGAELRSTLAAMVKDAGAYSAASLSKVSDLTMSPRDKVQALSNQGAALDAIYASIDATDGFSPIDLAALAKIDEAALVPFFAIVDDPMVTATVPYKCRTGLDCKADAKGVKTRQIPVFKSRFMMRGAAEGPESWSGQGAVSVVRFVEPVMGEGKTSAFSYVGIVTTAPAGAALTVGQHVFVFAQAPFTGVS